MIKIKMFDCIHELDLEEDINAFLNTIADKDLLSIQYQTSFIKENEDDIMYSYSAMLIYQSMNKE